MTVYSGVASKFYHILLIGNITLEKKKGSNGALIRTVKHDFTKQNATVHDFSDEICENIFSIYHQFKEQNRRHEWQELDQI